MSSIDRFIALASVAALASACGTELDEGVQFGSGDTGGAHDDGATSPTNPTSATGADGGVDTHASSDATADDTGGVKYDVGAGSETGGAGECDCGSQLGFSYIWVAISGTSWVSKINTTNLVEEGRYVTRPDAAGNPSRTSVSLSGRAVAVANRNGGLVKIWSTTDLCDPMHNGVAGVQTSSGPADVLAWGEDDCVAWYTEFPNYDTQRPVAWAPGTLDPDTCEYYDETVWTAGCDLGGAESGSYVHRVDGDTGTVLDTVYLADFDCNFPDIAAVGPYGGASDHEGNFWMIHTGPGKLARIDAVTLESEVWDVPPLMFTYGITVDLLGRPLVSSSGDYDVATFVAGAGGARFDPDAQTWESFGGESFRSIGGLQQDGAGRIWVAQWDIDGQPPAIRSVDADTLVAGPPVLIDADAGTVKGISIDVDGYVWAVTGSRAYKIDPDDHSNEHYDNLGGAYTYSDMTGWALQNVACDPAG